MTESFKKLGAKNFGSHLSQVSQEIPWDMPSKFCFMTIGYTHTWQSFFRPQQQPPPVHVTESSCLELQTYNESFLAFILRIPFQNGGQCHSRTAGTLYLYVIIKFKRDLCAKVPNKIYVLFVIAEEIKQEPKVGMEGLLNKLKGDEENEEKGEEKTDEVKAPAEDVEKQEEEVAKEAEVEEEEPYEDPILSGPQGSIVTKIMWFISLPLMVPMWITLPDTRNPTSKAQDYTCRQMKLI